MQQDSWARLSLPHAIKALGFVIGDGMPELEMLRVRYGTAEIEATLKKATLIVAS